MSSSTMSTQAPAIDPGNIGGVTNKEKKIMVEITHLIEQCASDLSYENPILSTASFSVQDSMAALELMDPKMDCCEIPMSQVAPFGAEVASDDLMVFPRPAPRGLNDPIAPLPWKTLTLRDAAWIGLESLARLESFLSGASAVESTFTCLYLHSPVLANMKLHLSISPEETSLTERFGYLVMDLPKPQQQLVGQNDEGTPAQYAVFAMSLAFLELTDVVRNICTNADIYEEEDFSVNTYGIPIYADRDEHTVVSLLKDVIAIFVDLKGPDQDADPSKQAILLILRFQLDFLTACTTMVRYHSFDRCTSRPASLSICLSVQGGLSSDNTLEAAVETKRVVLSGRQCLEQLRDILKRMREEESDHDKALIKSAFDSFVNRPLVGNAPVRKVIFNHVEDSIPVLIKVISEIDWSVCDFLIRGDTLGRIRRMLERVSSSSVNILSRSLIVLNLYFDEKLLGKMSMPDLVLHHMRQLSHVPDAVFQETYGEAFLHRLAKPVYDTLKLLTLNRNRQRTYMEAMMLQDWSALQQEAQAVDANFQKESQSVDLGTPYFTHYVLSTTLMLLDLYVTLGIEHKLFHGSHDLAIAFWYRDFLLSSQLNNSTTMRRTKMLATAREQLQQQQLQQQSELVKSSRGGKKKGGKHHSKKGSNGNKTDNASKLEDLEDEIEILMLGVKRGLSRGLVRVSWCWNQNMMKMRQNVPLLKILVFSRCQFIAALTQAGMVKPEAFEFTSHEQRFSKRFDAFSFFLQPPPLTYIDFCHGSDFSRVSQQDLVISTSECFKASKEIIDKLLVQIADIEACYRPIQEEELRELAKVCVGNSVFVQRLVQMVDATGKAKGTVSFDLSTHKRFCTIKLA